MKKFLAISFAIVALNIGVFLPFSNSAFADQRNGDDEVYMMVGDADRNYSGDFILVESNGRYGLIDAGTGNLELERQKAIYEFFDKKGITTFDFVIVTHAHVDHITALTTVYGTETFTLFDKYQVKELILKDYPDISDIPQTSAGELAEHNGRRLNAYNDMIARARANGAWVGFKNSVTLGDFKVYPVNNYPLSSAEKSAADFNLNFDSLGVLIEKNGYNMFLAGDIERFDFAQTISDLRNLGVNKLDAYKINHHGYSIDVNDPQTLSLMTDFNGANSPIVGITNSRGIMANNSAQKLAMIESTMTNGVYWHRDGITNFNFSNLDENGLVVSQVGNNLQSSVKHVNGQQVFSQARLANAPTKEDFIENKMRYIPPATPQNSTQQATEQKTEQTEIKAPNTGFEESKFVVYIGVIASVLALVALGLNKQTKTSKVKF